MIYAYCLKTTDTNEIKYIGLTKNIKSRKNAHKIKKPPHIFEILESFDCPIKAASKELEYIKIYDTFFSGWNKTPGGEYNKFSGYQRKGIGGVKKGTVPWNKGLKNCFSNETILNFKKTRKGIRYNKKTKLNESVINQIRLDFKNHSIINGVGTVQKNGMILSQERAFSKLYSKKYDITEVHLYNIVKNLTWKSIN